MTEVDYAEMRNKIHEALTETIQEEENEDTVLSGWSLIYEGVHADDRRSLTFLSSDATGDAPLTPWAARGFMEHVEGLFFNVAEDEGDEE